MNTIMVGTVPIHTVNMLLLLLVNLAVP